ncbi:hypothetical protein ES703_38860 [subsurface metagenome]
MIKQSLETKIGEITFRKKLVRYHLNKNAELSGEYTFNEIMNILE